MSDIQEFDFSVNLLKAILWQYDGSPNLKGLLDEKDAWYISNQTEFWDNWITDVFDLRTANSFGLGVWSIILNESLYRRQNISGSAPTIRILEPIILPPPQEGIMFTRLQQRAYYYSSDISSL